MVKKSIQPADTAGLQLPVYQAPILGYERDRQTSAAILQPISNFPPRRPDDNFAARNLVLLRRLENALGAANEEVLEHLAVQTSNLPISHNTQKSGSSNPHLALRDWRILFPGFAYLWRRGNTVRGTPSGYSDSYEYGSGLQQRIHREYQGQQDRICEKAR